MTWNRNPLTEHQIDDARRRLKAGELMSHIARRLRVRHDWLKCLLDPEHRERRAKRRREAARLARRKVKKDTRPIFHPEVRECFVVPRDVLIERERRALAPRSLTAQLFGDPPQGYSALDRMQQR